MVFVLGILQMSGPQTKRTTFLCGNRNGHHNTELGTLDTTIRKHTQNMTLTLLKTTRGKNESNIVFMRKS